MSDSDQIFKSKAGNLDSSDGEHYASMKEIMKQLRKIQDKKKQISVIKSVTKNFNETIQNLQID